MRIQRIVDGGVTWTTVLRNADPRAFFDCMALDGSRGWVFGDPVDGRFQRYATTVPGQHRTRTGDDTESTQGLPAFAARGTGIAHRYGTKAIASRGP